MISSVFKLHPTSNSYPHLESRTMKLLNQHSHPHSLKIKAKNAIVSLLILLYLAPSALADVLPRLQTSSSGRPFFSIDITAQIKPGDAQAFANILKKTNLVLLVNLNTAGGDVAEAVKIGEIIRLTRLATQVTGGGVCASACFLIWINGSNRIAAAPPNDTKIGKVGLHRPFLRNPENHEQSLKNQSTAIRKVSEYLESKHVPRRLIDSMMNSASNEIYWLTEEDISEIGVTPIEIQELYIAKCKHSPEQIMSRQLAAKLSGDKQLEGQLARQSDELTECTAGLDIAAQEAGLKKLRNGWMPKW